MPNEEQKRDLERYTQGPRGFLPKINCAIDALNEIKGRPGPPSQVFTTFPSGSGSTLTPVRISAFNATDLYYTGVKLQPNGTGGFSDVSPTVTIAGIFEKRGYIGIEIGARVWITSAGALTSAVGALATGTPVYNFEFVLPRQAFAVKVYKTSGVAGPPSTWVYTAKSPDDHQIATGLTPVLRRPASVATTAPTDGTYGTGWYDDAGVFSLFDSNESCG